MSFFTLRALLFVAECAAASILLPLLAFAATRLLHRAALRHLAWLTMFGVLAVLPVAALLLPARQIELPVATPAVAPVEMPAETMAPPVLPSIANLPVPAMAPVEIVVAPIPPAPPVISTPVPPAAKPLLTVENALLLLVLLWAAGLAWHLARMTLGGIGLMRLRRQSEIFGIANAPCQLLVSPQVSGPSTFGLFRPVILLPEGARDWNPARLEAVLAHEAAHVQRRDTLNQFVVRLVCALYWLNPLLWLAARALRREAELAADDAALASGLTPSAYAAELVALAAETRRPAPGVAMADSALAARVQAALAANISRKGVSRMDIARMASLGLAATLLLGTARLDLAMAQDKPANPAPVAKPAPAAPPARNVAPKVDIDINRKVERNIDVEVDAINARADAAAAEARARAAAEPDAVKRAQYTQEAARVAAEAAKTKARADETRQRATQVAQLAAQTQQRAQEAAARAQAAKEDALRRMPKTSCSGATINGSVYMGQICGGEKESMLKSIPDEEILAIARQARITVSPVEVDARLRSVVPGNLTQEQRAKLSPGVIADLVREKLASNPAANVSILANPRALEALREIRSQDDVGSLLRRTGAERMTLSADDAALLAAARERKITISPVEVNERLGGYMDRLRQRVMVDVTREKLAALQNENVSQTQMERPQPFMVSQVDGKPNYLLRRTYSSKDVSIIATFITPGFAAFSPDALKKLDAAIDAAMTEATGKYDAAWAGTPATRPIHNLIQLSRVNWPGRNVTVALDAYGPDHNSADWEVTNKRNAAIDASLGEAYEKIDAAFAEAKAASSIR